MPKKNTETFISRSKVYLAIISVLLIVISILNYKLIPITAFLLAGVIIYFFWSNKKRKAELSEQLKDLTLNVNNTAKTTLINSPFPLVIIESSGNLIWKSERYVSTFGEIAMEPYLQNVLKEIKITIENQNNKSKGGVDTEINVENNTYRIMGSYVKSKKSNNDDGLIKYTAILYFIDETLTKRVQKHLEESKINIGIIMIDNYEEVIQRISPEQKIDFMAKIEKLIYDWAARYNSLIIKQERDTFYLVIENFELARVKNDKFSILDDTKKLGLPEGVQATLSIALSNDGYTNDKKAESAKAVIDIALGRGGDQAIVKNDGRFEFFGGRTKEVEKRTKVKARTISHALTELIKDADNVIIMGHSNSDMDAIGSALGLCRLSKTFNKEAKVLCDTRNDEVNKFIEEVQKDEQEKCFITKEEMNDYILPNTLLIVTDTNKRSYVESPELLEKVSKIVIIDHHRRSTDYIENAILVFHEVYASSSCELVTEILQYAQANVELSTLEIEGLYAGIMLDTKNFTFKTGVRTFEAAAYLRKCGVDIIKVKKWFQNDLDTYQTISEIVSKAEVLNDSIAISSYDEENENTNILAAKAADELLTISGITASFVLGKVDNIVYISGRSIGDINVQLILEKLGGGGHITLAGAQLEDIGLEDAKQELINRINEYLFETEN